MQRRLLGYKERFRLRWRVALSGKLSRVVEIKFNARRLGFSSAGSAKIFPCLMKAEMRPDIAFILSEDVLHGRNVFEPIVDHYAKNNFFAISYSPLANTCLSCTTFFHAPIQDGAVL
jgi:hypothetical protein